MVWGRLPDHKLLLSNCLRQAVQVPPREAAVLGIALPLHGRIRPLRSRAQFHRLHPWKSHRRPGRRRRRHGHCTYQILAIRFLDHGVISKLTRGCQVRHSRFHCPTSKATDLPRLLWRHVWNFFHTWTHHRRCVCDACHVEMVSGISDNRHSCNANLEPGASTSTVSWFPKRP